MSKSTSRAKEYIEKAEQQAAEYAKKYEEGHFYACYAGCLQAVIWDLCYYLNRAGIDIEHLKEKAENFELEIKEVE